jgi:hypothetical protein
VRGWGGGDARLRGDCLQRSRKGRRARTTNASAPSSRKPRVERPYPHFGIPPVQVATLGDQRNDVPIFERSGVSIAVGNASEEVQRQATYVTASHEDEGFAKAIEQFNLPGAVAALAGVLE